MHVLQLWIQSTNLGVLYTDQGMPDKAEKMYMQALKGYERALDADHTSILLVMLDGGDNGYRQLCNWAHRRPS
jgi:hypothetical protein